MIEYPKEPTPQEIERGWTWRTDAMVNEIICSGDDLRSEKILDALKAAGLLAPIGDRS